MSKPEVIKIDEVEYVRKDSMPFTVTVPVTVTINEKDRLE